MTFTFGLERTQAKYVSLTYHCSEKLLTLIGIVLVYELFIG